MADKFKTKTIAMPATTSGERERGAKLNVPHVRDRQFRHMHQSYSFIASDSANHSFDQLLTCKTHLSKSCDLTHVLFPEHCEPLICSH
jgi:hypothetical protein